MSQIVVQMQLVNEIILEKFKFWRMLNVGDGFICIVAVPNPFPIDVTYV